MDNLTLNLNISLIRHITVDSKISDSTVIAGSDQVTKTVPDTPDNVAVVLQTCEMVTCHPGPESDTVVLTSSDHNMGGQGDTVDTFLVGQHCPLSCTWYRHNTKRIQAVAVKLMIRTPLTWAKDI